MKNVIYVILGAIFGILLYKAEVVSWYRIYEMFMFKSFHMYGIIGSAIAVGATSIYLLKKYKYISMTGEPISIPDKKFSKGNIIGGIIFGLGWGLVGACPGPMFIMIGAGYSFMFIVLFSALAGTWVYAALKEKLPN